MSTLSRFEHHDDNGRNPLKRLTGLWKKRKDSGEEYLAGTLEDGRRVYVFRNDRRDTEPDGPEYVLSVAPPVAKPAPKPEPRRDGFFGF